MNIINAIVRLSPYVKHLESQNSQLLSGEATVRDIAMENGVFTVSVANDAVAILASHMTTILEHQEAENYVEIQLEDKIKKERYILTIQRKNGKTPHQIRRELEQEILTLREKMPKPKTFVGYRYFCPEAHFLFSRNLTDRVVFGNHRCEECDAAYSYDLLQEVHYD